MTLKESLTQFLEDLPEDPCWKTPGSIMRIWAEEYEKRNGHRGHGLGDLGLPCYQEPGKTCPACGKQF